MLQAFVAFLALTVALPAHTVTKHDGLTIATYQGTFADGATYVIQVPSNWNGSLVLYSHGYTVPGQPNPAYDVGDPTTGSYLLTNGYALAGSSYASTGWAVAQALPDQIHVLDTFARLVGKAKRTIAWGHSMGGLITAALVQQYPRRFDAALPMCGVVAGGVGFWNLFLDAAVAFNTLLASGSLQVIDITSPSSNLTNAEVALYNAQSTAQGQARIALAAALSDTPGWYTTGDPPPPPTDYADREANQYLWFQTDFAFDFDLRAELEARAGGNPSFNTGIDYRKQLAKSVDRAEVEALYAQAGLSLDADLKALDATPRISAVPSALRYLSDAIIFDGKLPVPVLTLQTEGDGIVVNENESAYESAVRTDGDAGRLRREFVYRAGHCAFTQGEELAAFLALVHRMNTGHWDGLSPSYLNAVAAQLGSSYNSYPPAFDAFTPGPFLRTYNGPPP